MNNVPVWILTFNRPTSLNRIIYQLANEGFLNINIMSNHPKLQVQDDFISRGIIKRTIINSLNDEESNSWCTRSWNSIFLKNFKEEDEILCIQDDTTINAGFGKWFQEVQQNFDFIWGPAGDQFFYVTRQVFQSVGWWDERYLACFCGDADWMRRVYSTYGNARLSIEESHQWGFVHNGCGISHFVNNGDARQWNQARGGYINQCQQFEVDGTFHPVLAYCQNHYFSKWGVSIDEKISETIRTSLISEIDWYPWFTKKYLHRNLMEK